VDCGCFAGTSDRTGRKGRTPDIPTVKVSLFRSCDVTKISLTSVLRCLLVERRPSHCLPKTKTFVPDDRVIDFIVFYTSIGAPLVSLNISLTKRSTLSRFVENLHVSFPDVEEEERL